MSGQALAYLGDNVIELCVRSALIGRGFSRSGEMNKEEQIKVLYYGSALTQGRKAQHHFCRFTTLYICQNKYEAPKA